MRHLREWTLDDLISFVVRYCHNFDIDSFLCFFSLCHIKDDGLLHVEKWLIIKTNNLEFVNNEQKLINDLNNMSIFNVNLRIAFFIQFYQNANANAIANVHIIRRNQTYKERREKKPDDKHSTGCLKLAV